MMHSACDCSCYSLFVNPHHGHLYSPNPDILSRLSLNELFFRGSKHRRTFLSDLSILRKVSSWEPFVSPCYIPLYNLLLLFLQLMQISFKDVSVRLLWPMWVSVAINSFFCKKRYVSSVFFELISSVGRSEVSNLAESEILIFLIMLIILVVKSVAIIFLLMYSWKFHMRLLKPRFFVAASLAPLTDVSWWLNSFCKAILLCLVPLNDLWVSKIREAHVPLQEWWM